MEWKLESAAQISTLSLPISFLSKPRLLSLVTTKGLYGWSGDGSLFFFAFLRRNSNTLLLRNYVSACENDKLQKHKISTLGNKPKK